MGIITGQSLPEQVRQRLGIAMLLAGLITCVITFAILRLQARGYRPFELAITALLGLIVAGFLYETLKIGPSVPGSLQGPHAQPR